MSEWIVIDDALRYANAGLYQPTGWIRNHFSMLENPEYRALDAFSRGVWHGTLLAYVSRDGLLQEEELPAILGIDPVQLVSRALQNLEAFGFVRFVGAAPTPLSTLAENELAALS
jgi:hypothetical protein